MMTTVVTNFQRPDFLRRALRSLAAARVPKIVVVSCGTTPEVEAVHRWAASEIPGIAIYSREDDPGCNECWLAGVRACETEFIHILHDDDVVAKDFSQASAHLQGDVDVVLVDAFFQGPEPEVPSQVRQISVFHHPVLGGRIAPSTLMARLMMRGFFSLSPINGIIRKEVALAALEEAARSFTGPEWHVKPTMMVGNDLLLWIRTCQRARVMYYDNRPLVGYGEHNESTTIQHCITGRAHVLSLIYDRVRDYVGKV